MARTPQVPALPGMTPLGLRRAPIDHPLTRASHDCPLCADLKSPGLLTCWPCYNELGLRHGNPKAEAAIDAFEANVRSAITEGSLSVNVNAPTEIRR